MSINEHPNAKFFNATPSHEKKKFERRNDKNNKNRAKRIAHEAELAKKYLEEQKNG